MSVPAGEAAHQRHANCIVTGTLTEIGKSCSKVRQTANFRPVGLASLGLGHYAVINSVWDAARTLLHEWPVDDGEDYFEAVKSCLDAIIGDLPPDEVRASFIRAAQEAGISVIEAAD